MSVDRTQAPGEGRTAPGGERLAGERAGVPVLMVLRKHWRITLFTMLAVTLAVTFDTLGQTKIYEASAMIQFDPNPPRPLGDKVEAVDPVSATLDSHEYYETQYRILESMRVALSVVSQLGLHRDAGFLKNAPPGTILPPSSATEETAALALRKRLKIEPVKNSRLAHVKFEDADPDRAQRVVSMLVETYIAMNLEDARASTSQAADWLRGQLDKLKVELDSSEMALHAYKEEKNILSLALDDQSNMLREEMKQLNDALTAVRTKREEIAARREQLSKIRGDNPELLPASELLQSMLLQDLRRSYESAARERDATLKGGKGKNHPEVMAADARVDAARGALLAEVRNIQGALDGDLAVIKRQEGGLAGLFESANKTALNLNLLEIEYNRLRRSKNNKEKLYELVLERTTGSDMARMSASNNIRLVDVVMRPRLPVRPQVPLNISVGIFFGAILGIGAAMVRSLLDRTIKTQDDIDVVLGLPFLGLLPETGPTEPKDGSSRKRRVRRGEASGNALQNAPELIVNSLPNSSLAEASRAIRTNLMFMAPDEPFRTLLITSSGPAEGKTTVACCIAIAMAQTGQRVVLVDCDLRRPRIHRIFGLGGAAAGLSDAIIEEHEINEAIAESSVPNLSVVPSGRIPPNPAELFHSARFKTILEQLKERYDRVILDSPPVVAVTDAAVLSTQVDGVILVVRAFKTPKHLARHALRALLDVGARTAGIVLNAVNLDKSEYKYSHYYYYRKHGYGADDPPPDATSSGASADQSPS